MTTTSVKVLSRKLTFLLVAIATLCGLGIQSVPTNAAASTTKASSKAQIRIDFGSTPTNVGIMLSVQQSAPCSIDAGCFSWNARSNLVLKDVPPGNYYFMLNRSFLPAPGGKYFGRLSVSGATVRLGVVTTVRVDFSDSVKSVVLQNQNLNTTPETEFTWWRSLSKPDGWSYLAESGDGVHLLAGKGMVANVGTRLALSNDGGMSWAPTGPTAQWQSLAISRDGSTMIGTTWDFADDKGDYAYISRDFGKTWAKAGPRARWGAVASSSDGSHLVTAIYPKANNGPGQIYTSNDFGVTWVAHFRMRYWGKFASSDDGQKLAVIDTSDVDRQIFTSSDGGVTWTARGAKGIWSWITSSSDGTQLVASQNYEGMPDEPCEYIARSSDSGLSWKPISNCGHWSQVASSADGSRIIAASTQGAPGGQVFTSADFGNSWQLHNEVGGVQAVAISSDGRQVSTLAHSRGTQMSNLYIVISRI